MNRTVRMSLFAAVAAVALAGCGGESAAPKQELTDKDKQHIQQLKEQRADEWGSTNKKKK